MRRYGAAAVVMAFDEQRQADSLERRVAICRRAYRILVEEEGFPPGHRLRRERVRRCRRHREHERYAIQFIEAVRRIKAECPHALTSGGISNVSFSFRGSPEIREAMRGVPLSCDRGRPRHGHRERRSAATGLRRDSERDPRAGRRRAVRASAGRDRDPDEARRRARRRHEAEAARRSVVARAPGARERLVHALVQGIDNWVGERTRRRLGARCRARST